MRKISAVAVFVAFSVAASSTQAQPQPWPVRAHAVLAKMLRGPSGVTVAQSIQRLTHPSGSDANLANVDIRHLGDSLSVRLTVSWSGGLGAAHMTVVAWDFDHRRHRSAAVLSDDAPFAPSEKSARQLDTYFRDELYPILRQNTGD
jgi:hypothetical protein